MMCIIMNYQPLLKSLDIGDTICIKLCTRSKFILIMLTYCSGKIPEITIEEWHDNMQNSWNMTLNWYKNGRADTLSRCPDYNQSNNNNKNLTVLPPRVFSKAYYKLIKEGPKDDKKEERTPLLKKIKTKSKKKAIKFSIRMMGSEKANPNNGK